MNAAASIVLHLDRSTPARLCLERDGQPVEMEEAFKEGFQITPNDATAILSWAVSFVQATNYNQC